MEILEKIIVDKIAPSNHNILWCDVSKDTPYLRKYINGLWKCIWISSNDLRVYEDVGEHVNVTCFEGQNGSITVEADGGIPPYKYSIDGNTWQDENYFDDLSVPANAVQSTDEYGGIWVGTYRIYVKDAKNHTAYTDVNIQSPVQLEWLDCPSDMVFYCDEGQTYATIIPGEDFTIPTLSTVANNADVNIVHTAYPSENHFSVGTEDIMYQTHNDCDEYPDNCKFNITVLPRTNLYLVDDKYSGNQLDSSDFTGNSKIKYYMPNKQTGVMKEWEGGPILMESNTIEFELPEVNSAVKTLSDVSTAYHIGSIVMLYWADKDNHLNLFTVTNPDMTQSIEVYIEYS